VSTPNGWDEALIAAGFTDRRSGKGPSWTALAEAIGKHPSTLTAMRDGTRRTDQATIDAVAKALHLDPRLIAKWAGRARSEADPYVPPSEANLLDRDERDAVDRLISLLARPRMTGDSSDGRQPDAEKSDEQQGSDAEKDEPGLTWQERRRARMIAQAMNVEEAADMHPLQADYEVADEDVSQDPDDWGERP
jgi:cytochrome oxidase assembly protein ShyY1